MKTGRWLLGLVVAVGVVAAPASAAQRPAATADFAHTIRSDQRFALQPNTTQTYAMRIAGLGTDANTLLPCFGFDIDGPGVALAAADLEVFGPVVAEPSQASSPDGGIPGAQRQPDGTLVIPDSAAILDQRTLAMGESCEKIGWDFYTSSGRPRLDPWGNPAPAGAARARSASAKARAKAKHRKALHRAHLKMRGATAQDGNVQVTLAGFRNVPGDPWGGEIVVTVRTGALAGTTTLTTHARVLPQRLAA
jgi:hypothetical protein